MKHATLLWMDLEMTGLDPENDRILEVAVIATDWDMNELAAYEAVIKVDKNLLSERMEVSKDFWAKNSHARDGLIAQNTESGRDGQTIESELLEFIKYNFTDDEPVLLAGNSIHQDRRFIVTEWPQLDARLHYRMLDVSAWKVVFANKYRKKFMKPEAHRALSDIRGSIEEMNYYIKYLERGLHK